MLGLTMEEVEKVLNAFCDRYEGSEGQIGCPPLVYGDLLLIADEQGIEVEKVTKILLHKLEVDNARC